MLKEYSIHHLLGLPSQYIPYYADTFEGMEDRDGEWPHRHTFYSLVWFTKGSGFYVIDSNEYEIKQGRIFLVNPKQVHNWDYSENSEGYVLVVDSSLGTELGIELHVPYIDLDEAAEVFLEPIVKNIISECEAKNDIKLDIQYLYKVLGRYAKDSKPTQTNPIFEKFKLLVVGSIEQQLLVEDYAKSLRISVNELNTLTKQAAGVSAKQYLLDLKVTEAKRLLLYGNHNVNEVAFCLGFEDSSYFARIFKVKTSLSPSEFLKKYRK